MKKYFSVEEKGVTDMIPNSVYTLLLRSHDCAWEGEENEAKEIDSQVEEPMKKMMWKKMEEDKVESKEQEKVAMPP